MDVLEVYDAISEAVKSVRETQEPLFFEIKTYRYRGHSMSDPAKYRTKDELDSYKVQDPIEILKKQLLEEKLFDEKKLDAFDEEAKKISADSVTFSENSAEPSIDSLYEDVYK
jgi:pyruvate dehydrogenase E1 component alpha subunit